MSTTALLARNWRRDVIMLLLVVQSSFLLAMLPLPLGPYLLIFVACEILQALLVFGDFMKGLYDTLVLEEENEVLKAENAALMEYITERINGPRQ